ncbi:MAG TPA: glycosyltransferase, partial [Terriglobales bacterium]|nr:glycosyltransferase [Terriglobales bacterium]
MNRGRWALVGVYVALVGLHATLLRLPYFWDEAGYYVFAALDVFRHGWVIPHSTLANGHPPLLSLYLSLAWMVGGFHPLVTRLAMLGWAAALVWGVYRLAGRHLDALAAALAAGLVGLTPLVFAQSTLAQLDLPVAALVVWALAVENGWAAVGLLTAACLMKETAVLAPLTLAAWDVWHYRRLRQHWLIPVLVLGAWFAIYHHVTGYWFGNPQYFAYNLSTTAGSLPRIGLALLRRCWQLAIYDGTGLLTLLAAVAWWRAGKPRSRIPGGWWAIMAVYLVFHALVGGAVLARYLLPALALFYIALAEWLVRLPKP